MDIVLSLNWTSAYQSVRGLVLHLAASWRDAGLELVELDVSANGWADRLREILNTRRVRFVFSTAGVGTNLMVDGTNLWAKLNLPFYSLLMDHPAYFAANHRGQPKTVVLGYMFRDHALYQASDVKADNIVTSIDFGIPDLPVKPANKLTAQGRPKIIFAKTGNSPAALVETWRSVPKLEAILQDALDELAFSRNGFANVAAFHPLLNRVGSAHKIELQPFSLLSRFLIVQIDDYIRRLKSTAIAEAILPFDVDVFGTSWEHIDTSKGRAKFHGPVDYARLEAEFPNATASLTMNPNIELSAHDRFFTALGAGIMPVSDRNQYIENTFPELLPYTFDFTLGSVAAALERVVSNPVGALETARAVRARTRPTQGVEQAATSILGTMQAASFLQTCPRPGQNFFVP